MHLEHDQEFSPPIGKVMVTPSPANQPTSKLSVVSLVSAILGITVFPLIGGLIAIVTGHAAMGEIRESEGRLAGKPMAKAGLWLGYGQTLLIVVVAVLGLFLFFHLGPRALHEINQIAPTSQGVKMVNEMDRGDYNIIEESKLDVPQEDIIACYYARSLTNNPEFALVTKDKLFYLKDGRTTVFKFDQIKSITGDSAYRALYGLTTSAMLDNLYYIEVQSNEGQRMRIVITPGTEGGVFYDTLQSRVQGSAKTPKPVMTKSVIP